MLNKKVLSKIDLGSYTKPNPFHKDIIYDPKGQWEHPGQNTRIPGGDITMQGVPYPVYAQPNIGQPQMMYPDQNYQFPGADYVDEFPQMKKGGRIKGLVSMPKPSKKGLMSNKYSRSLDATNKLFTENFLFAKPKSRKNKVFDPNAKYYAKGGALLTKEVTCKKCGWEWDAADGGKDITTCHKCNGQGLVHAQDGGNKDAMTGMMKARLAYANEFGNPAAKRMINIPDNPYQFDNGNTGTHYMASMDNYAVPQIQDENGVLQLGDYGPESNEAIRFDSDEDANYFAENYKDVSPGFIEADLDEDEIEEYRKGGYVVEDISIPSLNQMQDGGENENLPNKVQDLNEVTVYGNQEKIKLQGSLMDRLKQVKKAYNDHRVNLGLEKQKQSAEGTSSIISLKDQIQSYKKELNEEKKSYDKASKALNVLKKYNPESYKKAKVSDVLNSTGVDDLRNLYKEGKISDATFMDFYDNFGKSYDREVTRTTEEDQVKLEDSWYGKPDEKGRTRWMGNPNNVAKVAQAVAIGAPLAAAAPMMAPAVVSTLANPYVAGGLNAYFAGHGINEFSDPNSLTRKSMSRAYDDPTGSNIGDAAFDVGMNSLNFVGLPFGKAIKGSKNLINNTYKINPWAFKANPEAYYHRSPNLENIVNKETGTLQGFGNSKAGIEFSKDAGPGGTGNLFITPNGKVTKLNLKKPANSQLYFAKGVPLDFGRYNKVLNKKTGKLIDGQGYEGPYMVEVEGVPMGASTKGRAPGADVTNIGGYAVPRRPISLDEAKFYKEHWLKGYKEVPKELPGSPNVVSSVDDVVKKPWQMEELPGLHLQSTMEGEAISKIVDKTGKINTEQALAIIAKESGGADKVALIKQGLGETIPKKIDFNEFRKTVQDQLIPLERQFVDYASDYGINRLGYKEPEFITRNVNGKTINELTSDVIENQTLVLSNKGKFGRGSSAHGNPEETLGHVHFLRDAETPDVLTVTQIQSDAFQGTHRMMPKTQQEALEKVNKLKEEGEYIKSMYGDGRESSNSVLANYEKHFQLDDASAKNFTQKQLLDKNHQERYLQELVNYAGERGDVNKLRLPTSETAAKVQGYSKVKIDDNSLLTSKEIDELKSLSEKYNKMPDDVSDDLWDNVYDPIRKRIEEINVKRAKETNYSSEHQTILKKYSEQPKLIKKLFKQDAKTITDNKGNTWYEFNIPEKFKKGKGEIKAFSTIGTGVLGLGLGATQYKQGGASNDYVDAELTLEKIKDLIAQGYVIEELN